MIIFIVRIILCYWCPGSVQNFSLKKLRKKPLSFYLQIRKQGILSFNSSSSWYSCKIVNVIEIVLLQEGTLRLHHTHRHISKRLMWRDMEIHCSIEALKSERERTRRRRHRSISSFVYHDNEQFVKYHILNAQK